MLKRKILFVYHVSSIGGGSFALLNILKNIDRSKNEPILLLRSDGPLVDEARKLEIQTLFMPSLMRVPYNESVFNPSNAASILKLILSLRDFNRIIGDINPDVVYINTMMMYPYLIIAKRNKKGTIIHIREHWPQDEHIIQRNTAISVISKYADKIIAINTFSASMFPSRKNAPTIVYDWIDMDSRKGDVRLEDLLQENLFGKKVFLYMGGVQKTKGAYNILFCFTNYILGNDYRLLALGIPKQYTPKGVRGHLSKVFSIFGYKTYEEKVIKLANSDDRIICVDNLYELKTIYEQVYCVLSYFTIPHANLALAESIICHTVNIASLTEESLEYSHNGELALLFKENDTSDFLVKIKSLDEVYTNLKSRLAKDSHLIQELFDPQSNIYKLNTVIDQL